MPRTRPPLRPTAALPSPEELHTLLSFLEHDPAPMMVLDPAYNILAANTAYRRQFGTADASPWAQML